MLDLSVKPGLAVHAVYKLHEDDVPPFLELARALVERTSGTPGCVYFTIAQDVVDPTRFRFSEAWTDKEALGAYGESEAFRSSLAKAMTLRVLDRSGIMLTVSDAQPVEMPS